MKSNNDIKRDVENELRWNPAIDAADITIAVKSGIVQLSGRVKRYCEKFDAEAAAKRVAGVAGIANDIEVHLPGADQRPDPDIARDAAAAIDRQLPTSAKNIRAAVSHGQITLEGTVDWHFQRERAESAVHWLKGVRGVSNLIRITPPVAASEINRKIQDALRRHAAIDASNITVEAAGGDVTLRGKVRSWVERDEARRVAWAAPGVANVDDRITIFLHDS
jgi:osmotically-inducible protein OsmY